MKKQVKALTTVIALMMAVCLVACGLTACGGKTVTVTVNDQGTTTEVEATTGNTVEQTLSGADIKLGEKDETEPAKDEKITEDTKEIIIKRYAKVTVVYGDEKKEVELVGGTVEQAIEKSGFKLDKGVAPDKNKADYLTDGMVINLIKSMTVSITVDGKTSEVSTAVKTVKDLLKEQKITLGDDDIVSPKQDTALKEGLKITIKRVTYKEEKKTEKVDFETKEQYDDSMADGTSKVTQEGVEGEKTVTYKVKYIDGKEDSREAVKEEVTKKPVDKIVTYGTYTESSNDTGSSDNGGGSVSSDDGSDDASVQDFPDCDGSGHGYRVYTYPDGSSKIEEY